MKTMLAIVMACFLGLLAFDIYVYNTYTILSAADVAAVDHFLQLLYQKALMCQSSV